MSLVQSAAQRPIPLAVVGSIPGILDTLSAGLSTSEADVQVTTCAGIEDLWALQPPPQILLVLQRHPDDVSSAQVRQIINAFPLVRLIVAYGPWCDSDGRTRDLWPAACRVAVDDVVLRLRREIHVVQGHLAPLPLTGNRDDCWGLDSSDKLLRSEGGLTVMVQTPDPAMANWISDALASAGHRPVLATCTAPVEETVDVLLFDADPWTSSRESALTSTCRKSPQRPVIALAGFLWQAEAQSLRDAGVHVVLSKLTPVTQLWRVLAEVTASTPVAIPPFHVVSNQ